MTDTGLMWKTGVGTIPGAPAATVEYEGWGYDIGESVLDVDKKQFSYGYNDWGTVNPYADPYVGLGGDCWMANASKWREPNASEVKSSAECIIISDVIFMVVSIDRRRDPGASTGRCGHPLPALSALVSSLPVQPRSVRGGSAHRRARAYQPV